MATLCGRCGGKRLANVPHVCPGVERAYPRGKLNADDEGATKIAVGVNGGTVIIAFPQPTTWIGLGYDEARALGETLIKRAEEIKQ